ncbi:Cob(I)yrinic acid a,c-diamide adenosyltransferase, mitochondrial [Porphyridium purpureum]|uniref:Corrinoid adenosyltransferase MMAB n=1 Tax=Porphyridium purpureum TaxID=35688 RepID=A0A5J4Z025_PORPP|nr:Cob(I)yrinic acid a,c-diamide adenosyltransferase, mitochondrial [Porphyridium purpureum]|eukprot:POR2219..scf208_2
MKIYTRTGDDGTTSLFNGLRVPKNEPHVDAYGTVDELNSTLGLAASLLAPELDSNARTPTQKESLESSLKQIRYIQNRLFDLGAHLATPLTSSDAESIARTGFKDAVSELLEKWMDAMDADLPKLTTFIVPGGHAAASALHMARTICRRAERQMVPLLEQGDLCGAGYKFMNRLSDYLFMVSRHVNILTGDRDVLWSKDTTV